MTKPVMMLETLRADQRPERQPYASSCTPNLKLYPDPPTSIHQGTTYAETAFIAKKPNG